jgi:inner membrane protein
VDWITHALLGALIGEWIFGKRLGNRALAWGAFIGLLPEFDVFLYPLLDHARELEWHRGPSHSIFLAALVSYAGARGLEKIWKKDQISRAEAAYFVFTLLAAQLLVKCLTVKGAAVLWPILRKRVAFDVLNSTDYFFSLPLFVILVWMLCLRNPNPGKKSRGKKKPTISKRRKLGHWALGFCVAYIGLAIGMKSIAASGFTADLLRRKIPYERQMESPTPYNPLLWRAVIDRKEEFWVGYRTVFERHETPVRWTIYPKKADALAPVAEMRETKTLIKLCDGWYLARPHAKGAWLGDIREPEIRIWGSKKGMVDSQLKDLWLISIDSPSDALSPIIPDPEKTMASDRLQRMAGRIIGNRENWEANPRLTGLRSSLPEVLAVVE